MMKTDIQLAREILRNGKHTLVVVRGWVEIVSSERGILPLLMVYDKCRATLQDASLADKVIGKAAALILAETDICQVYAEVMSEEALPVFHKKGIRYSYGTLVPQIMDPSGKELCPLEKSCRQIDDPVDGLMAITAYLCRDCCCTTAYPGENSGGCKCT